MHALHSKTPDNSKAGFLVWPEPDSKAALLSARPAAELHTRADVSLRAAAASSRLGCVAELNTTATAVSRATSQNYVRMCVQCAVTNESINVFGTLRSENKLLFKPV